MPSTPKPPTHPRQPDRTMRAAVLYGKHDLRLEQTPVPAVGPNDVLLKVAVVGVCGTDAAEWNIGPRLFPVHHTHPVSGHSGPMIIGHEFSGTVVAVGSDVDPAWLGRLVASCGAQPCGKCTACSAGRSNICSAYTSMGVYQNGALATYVSTPVASCIDAGALGLSDTEAALVQPMAIALHALRQSRATPTSVAFVQGIGGIGAFLVHALSSLGARVIAVDLSEARLEVATQLGAAAAILGGSAHSEQQFASELAGNIPVMFEVSGTSSGLEQLLRIAPTGSQIVQVGLHKSPFPLDLAKFTTRELSLVGTNALCRETDFPEAAALVAARRGKWGVVAPTPLPIEELVDGALAPMSAGRPPAIKSLIRP